MREMLQAAIESLYETFAGYPLNREMAGCPCCISKSDKDKLLSRPLRELSGVELEHYAFKAMSTWGEVSDFKHFLPRIFELAATTDFELDEFVVVGKLAYGDWEKWPMGEQASVKAFLWAWWDDQVNGRRPLNRELMVEVVQLLQDGDTLLANWNTGLDSVGFRNLIDFIQYDLFNWMNHENSYKAFSDTQTRSLCLWIFQHQPLLETAFFHFDDPDPEFAEDISQALSLVEQAALHFPQQDFTPQQFRTFATHYTQNDYSRIKFEWNGLHGKDFEDPNHDFRLHLCEAVKEDLSNCTDALISDLYMELSLSAKETFGVYRDYHRFANEMLKRDGTAKFEWYVKGAMQSMDTALSGGRLDLSKERLAEILTYMKVQMEVSKDKELLGGCDFMLPRFEHLLKQKSG